jgi:hypothetical protein
VKFEAQKYDFNLPTEIFNHQNGLSPTQKSNRQIL